MENKLKLIQTIQSLEDLNAIEEELKQTILLLEDNISISREEFDVISKQYREKWNLIYQEIKEKEMIIAQICAQRAAIEERQHKHEEEQLERTKRMRSEEDWRKIIDELTKEGFPENNEKVLELFEAYSHVTTTEEEIEHAMSLLLDYKRQQKSNGPFWLNKNNERCFSNGFDVHFFSDDGFGFALFDVETHPNGIGFWADERYYYLELSLSCGCEDRNREFNLGSQKCDELSIQLPKESDAVVLHGREREIVRIDREACPYNKLILLDFSVLLECSDNECESAPMSMVFAPSYLKKHYLREHNDA